MRLLHGFGHSKHNTSSPKDDVLQRIKQKHQLEQDRAISILQISSQIEDQALSILNNRSSVRLNEPYTDDYYKSLEIYRLSHAYDHQVLNGFLYSKPEGIDLIQEQLQFSIVKERKKDLISIGSRWLGKIATNSEREMYGIELNNKNVMLSHRKKGELNFDQVVLHSDRANEIIQKLSNVALGLNAFSN